MAQGLMHFPGIAQIRAGTFTLSHGITPSAALLQVVPQAGLPSTQGTFSITFGGVTIQFKDCVIDQASLRRSEGGALWSLRIVDRRWKWRYGEISGWYNRRLADGTLDSALEKRPRELAALLLQAMGETSFAVDELPDESRPEVDWTGATPAVELGSLAESLGCRVVLGIDDTVRVRRKGVGASLPVGGRTVDGFGVNPPEKPDKLKLIGGPIVWENTFRLEAVGKDTDGSIKPVNDLSYVPASGNWFDTYPEWFESILDTSGEEAHSLALETVYRWYRIQGFAGANDDFTDQLPLPGQQTLTVEMWQVLPLGTAQLTTYTDDEGEQRPTPPQLLGTFWDGRISGDNKVNEKIERGWTLDHAQGIVKFSEPLYRVDASDNNRPARLVLQTSHTVKDATTRQELRYERERTLSGASQGTKTAIIRRDDVIRTIKLGYAANFAFETTTDSLAATDQEADHHLNAAQAEFQLVQTQDVEYAGILPIQPDGAIQQVAWQVGLRGAFTRASTNSEFDAALPSYERRQEIIRQREADKFRRAASRSKAVELPINTNLEQIA